MSSASSRKNNKNEATHEMRNRSVSLNNEKMNSQLFKFGKVREYSLHQKIIMFRKRVVNVD